MSCGDVQLPCADPSRLKSEVQIGVAGEAYPGQDVAEAEDFVAGQAAGFRQAQPAFKPAFAVFEAVLIIYPPDPSAAESGLRAIRQNRGVFPRNDRLIVEAVQHPALNLFPGQASFDHGSVERVRGVIFVNPLP